MALDFDAEEITVTLTEDRGRQEGFATRKPGKPMTFTVATRFGAARTRLVQDLVERTGGGLTYIEASGGAAGAAAATRTLVVPPARTGNLAGNGRDEGYLRAAADFVKAAMAKGRKVVVYGSARTRWEVSAECGRSRENLRDSETSTEVETRRAGRTPTRLRKEF